MLSLQEMCLENVPSRYNNYFIFYYFNNSSIIRVEFDKFPVRPVNEYCKLIAYDIDEENNKVNSLLFFDSINKLLFNSTKEVCEKYNDDIIVLDRLVNRYQDVGIIFLLGLSYIHLPYQMYFIRNESIDEQRKKSLIADILYNYTNLRCDKCGKFNININGRNIIPFSNEGKHYTKTFMNSFCVDCRSSFSLFELMLFENFHIPS